MNVTRDVITDLLPLYFSGEASDDSRKMVEEFFRQDPEFAHLARRLRNVGEKLVREVAAPEPALEKQALKKTREMLQARNLWAGFGIAYMLCPLLTLRHHGQWWVMFFDQPQMAFVFFMIGAGFVMLAGVFAYKLRRSGL
jgi:anti-sigma factor RsiW